MGIWLDRLWQFVDEAVPAILIGVITILVTADIILRNLFGTTIPNGIELVTYAFVWMIFLGAAGASRRNDHFQADLLGAVAQGWVRLASRFLVDIVCAVVAAVMAQASWEYTMRSFRRVSEGMQLPLGYFYLIFPICFALMALAHLRRAIVELRRGPVT